MFAVIVLGIGFIMIAAIFPVSISQTRLTVDETAAAANSRAGLAIATRILEGGDTPPSATPPVTWGPLVPVSTLYASPPATPQALANGTITFDVPANSQVTVPGKVLTFYDLRLSNGTALAPATYKDNLWNAFKGNLIPPSDTRFAWVPLYKRDVTYFNTTAGAQTVGPGTLPPGVLALPAPYAQVYFLPVAVRNRTNFQTNPLMADYDLAAAPGIAGNLLPRLLFARIMPEGTSTSGYVIAFDYEGGTIAAPGPYPTDTIGENAFVVISDDHISTPNNTPSAPNLPVNHGRMNGRVFRVGVRRSDLDGVAPFFINKDTNRNMIVWELAAGADFSKDTGANGKFHNPAAAPPDGDTDDIVAIGNGSSVGGDTTIISNAIRTALNWTAADFFSESTGPAEVLVIGRSLIPNTAQYEGLPQDVSAYVTFIKVN